MDGIPQGSMPIAIGLAFLLIGAAHFIGVGTAATRDHYVKQWGQQGETYRWVVGLAFIAMGVNLLAAAAGLPHVALP